MGSEKKGKFLQWLGKAVKKVPSLIGAASSAMTGNLPDAFTAVKEILAKESSVESRELSEDFQRYELEFQKEVFALETEDRKDARQMYKSNDSLQKAVAYFSLAGFTIFTGASMWMAYEILQNQMQINEFVIMTVSNGNGIFTGLIFTLKDFLFGGSVKPVSDSI